MRYLNHIFLMGIFLFFILIVNTQAKIILQDFRLPIFMENKEIQLEERASSPEDLEEDMSQLLSAHAPEEVEI